MKKLLIIALLVFTGCAGEKPTDTATGGTVPTTSSLSNLTVSGKVQNGPYRQFTQGTIQGLDASFNQVVGQSATAETSDVIGTYASQITFTGTTYARVTFTGQHFVENTGAYSGTDLTTSSYVFGASDSNVNLVTHIIQDRVKSLVLSSVAIDAAMLQASVEFIQQLTGEVVTTGANTWLISDTSPLLLISALLQHGAEGSALQLVINDIRADFADGTLSQTNIDLLKANATGLDEASIHANVLSGLGITSQSFTARLSALDPSRLEASKFVQGTGVQSGSATAGASMVMLVPFKVNTATQANYMVLPCASSSVSIHASDGAITGVYGLDLVQNLTISYGTQLASASYTPNVLPLRDYGNGVITQHQATFAAPLDLAAGVYWARIVVDAGCVLQTYEDLNATTGQFLINETVTPAYFTYPAASAGLNTLHLELL